MAAEATDHVEIFAEALGAGIQADEEVFASAEVLANRLDIVNRLGGLFEGVSFSQAAREFLKSCPVVN